MTPDDLEAATIRMIEIALEAGTAEARAEGMIPIGINLTSIGVTSEWWMDSARAGRAGRLRGRLVLGPLRLAGQEVGPCLECWTTLTAAAAHTSRVERRQLHEQRDEPPSGSPRADAGDDWDQSGGRVELGIGVGGSGPELTSYGIDLPGAAGASAHPRGGGAVIRLMWSGGPVNYSGNFFHSERGLVAPGARATATHHRRRREARRRSPRGTRRRRLDDQRGRLRAAAADPP